jgi:hypothetical protein
MLEIWRRGESTYRPILITPMESFAKLLENKTAQYSLIALVLLGLYWMGK